MVENRKGEIMPNGILNINKPSGVSSAAIVGKIKRITGISCGHFGTLDPMASGVLPIGVGNATRLFDYLLQKEKVYTATFLFGADSDTLDSTGKIVYGGKIPSESEILSILPSQIGEIMQEPPLYSAKSINGVRAYDLARKGVEFTLQKKKVIINSIKLNGKVSKDEYSFTISCGGGTYIRSIARDIATSLNTKAIMTSLIREQSGEFKIENSVKVEELTRENFENYLISTQSVLSFPELKFSGIVAKRLADGLTQPCLAPDGLYKLWLNDNFYGIAEVENKKIKTKTKLC